MGIIKPGEPDFYADVAFERKPHGAIMVDGVEVAHTKQCCHCGMHFISRRGSGAIRMFCSGCNDVTCGSPECIECVPLEKRLERVEKRRS